MSRTKLLTVSVIALLLLNFGTLAFLLFGRSPKHGPPPGAGEGPKYLIIARLHFNQTQQQHYSDMVEEHRSKSRELNGRSRELHDELFQLLKAKDMDEARKTELIGLIAENQKAIEQLNTDHFLQIKSLCKGVQLEHFDRLVDDLGRLFAPQHPPK